METAKTEFKKLKTIKKRASNVRERAFLFLDFPVGQKQVRQKVNVTEKL